MKWFVIILLLFLFSYTSVGSGGKGRSVIVHIVSEDSSTSVKVETVTILMKDGCTLYELNDNLLKKAGCDSILIDFSSKTNPAIVTIFPNDMFNGSSWELGKGKTDKMWIVLKLLSKSNKGQAIPRPSRY